MSDGDPPSLEVIERKWVVGIDGMGATHYLDPVRRTIYVVADGEIHLMEKLGRRPLVEWILYVDGERGWGDLRYSPHPYYNI